MGWNKKGYTTLMMIAAIFVGFFVLIFLGIMTYGLDLVDESFSSIDFNVTNDTSWNETYNNTLGVAIDAARNDVPDLIGTLLLLGMVLGMMFVGYSVRKIGPLWAMLDIIIIIVAEVLAFLITSSFTNFINSSPEILAIFSNRLSTPARFILNLPIIIPVAGALVMLTTYLTTRKKEESITPGF